MGQSSSCQPSNFAVKNGASFQAIEAAVGSPAATIFFIPRGNPPMQYHRARRARAPPPETMSAPFSVTLATRQQKKVRTPDAGTRTRKNPPGGSLRHVVHPVVAAHDRQVDPERHLNRRMAQPRADHVERNLPHHEPMPSSTMAQGMSPSPPLPSP